jgi:phosphoglycolate phosphatase
VTFSSQLKAVVFDLDGTLLDTAPEFIQVVHQLRDEHGLPRLSEDLIRSYVSNGARALVTLTLGIQQEDEGFEDKRLRLLEIYADILGSATLVYAGIEDLLAQLAAANISWGISTNKPSAYAQPLLQAMNLQPPHQSLVCPDDVEQPKPHPEPLLLNCVHLRCRPEQVIYIGDHLRDIEAGRAAGMTTIAAAYGYIEAGEDPNSWGADAIVHDSRELAAAIAKLLH